MSASLLEQVRGMGSLGRAWRVIHENGRSSQSRETRREIAEFARDAESQLTRIQRQLNRGAFRFAPAKGVAASKKGSKGIRPLVVAPIRSRIVQRSIHDVLLRVPAILRYAENPYSFGGVRKKEGSGAAAVPGAIEVVLAAIGTGARYVIRSDISSFFTRIPKPVVTSIVAGATNEPDFVKLFEQAIAVELENLAALKGRGSEFPIYEIGVAQGNSLSPLLGNLLLHDFDREMNSRDCRCLRYIDDFIILAPDQKTAEREFTRAKTLLANLDMAVSPHKTFKGDITRGFVFLGIDIANGAIRPSRESRVRLLSKVSAAFTEGARALRSHRNTGKIDRQFSLIRTLHEVSGIVSGWGHHYSFCNEKAIFSQLDVELDGLLRAYLGAYSDAIKRADSKGKRRLIGIALLEDLVTHPFVWPRIASVSPATPQPPAPSESAAI
jgi:RNA-directed DNA polymerase